MILCKYDKAITQNWCFENTGKTFWCNCEICKPKLTKIKHICYCEIISFLKSSPQVVHCCKWFLSKTSGILGPFKPIFPLKSVNVVANSTMYETNFKISKIFKISQFLVFLFWYMNKMCYWKTNNLVKLISSGLPSFHRTFQLWWNIIRWNNPQSRYKVEWAKWF